MLCRSLVWYSDCFNTALAIDERLNSIQKHYCSDPGNNSLNGMNIYYKNYSGIVACNNGFRLYSLMPIDKTTFFSTTIYRINNLAFQFIFYPILHVSFGKDPSSQLASIENL